MRRICFLLVGAIAFGISLFSSCVMAQSARSLFSSGGSVTFNAKQNEVSTKNVDESAARQNEKYSGLRYALFQQMTNGELKKASPNNIFKNGDRIKVVLTSNKTGELSVVNIDPQGKASVLMEKSIVAGVDVSVPANGFLKFVGSAGTEQLIFVLSSKSLKEKTSESSPPKRYHALEEMIQL